MEAAALTGCSEAHMVQHGGGHGGAPCDGTGCLLINLHATALPMFPFVFSLFPTGVEHVASDVSQDG